MSNGSNYLDPDRPGAVRLSVGDARALGEAALARIGYGAEDADIITDQHGNSTISILPAIVPTGQFQNVTASAASGALIQVFNTAAAGQAALSGLSTPQALLISREAFAFFSFPGDVPEGVDMGYEDHSPEIGVSLRFVRVWDGYRDTWVNRFDVYYGIGALYMEGACRISG